MASSCPRALTVEELVLLQAPSKRLGETSPLRIPPGTDVAVELLGPELARGPAAPTEFAPVAGGGTAVPPSRASEPSEEPPVA